MPTSPMTLTRRAAIGLSLATPLVARTALAQSHQHHGAPFQTLQGNTVDALTEQQLGQRVVDSPAPKGAPGRWEERARLPLPRSEMAWATAWQDRMHVVGGYGEGRVNRAYHHVYDPKDDRWHEAAPLPRGANHVAVVAEAGRLYALGGFTEQNRTPDANAYVFEIGEDRWRAIAPLPRERGAASAVALGGRIHLIGGASGPTDERASVGWHEAYDIVSDRWERRKPLPGARDHAGAVAWNGLIHVIGGRFNTFEYNTGLHHVYLPGRDTWERRAALPTPRSGHGLVVLKGRFFAMGGEQRDYVDGRAADRVFGVMESYDPAADTWQSHAPMPIPRHGLGAALLGDWIHVAGGGPIVGGSTQSAIHEAFTLG